MKNLKTLREDKTKLENDMIKLIDEFVYKYNDVKMDISVDLSHYGNVRYGCEKLTGSSVSVTITL